MTTKFPFDIVGFDLDGTLLDTAADLAAATNHALFSIGRKPLPVADIRPMIGGGGRLMLRRGLDASGGGDEALLDRVLPVMLAYYEAHICAFTAPFPGLEAALDALAALDVKVAVVTNKREKLARKLLDELGLTQRFVTVIGGDTLGPGKAKPDAAPVHEMIVRCGGGNAVFVGDSHFDIDAAHNAGIPAIACRFGYLTHPAETLGADAIIDHFDELVAVARGMAVPAD
jgi:phosphoglycolate phosphatase